MEDKNNNELLKQESWKHAVQNGVLNLLHKTIKSDGLAWQENITIIDLTQQNIEDIDHKAKFPPNLIQLNLSNNKLIEVPSVILNLEKLVVLNLSHNNIEYFDDWPNFCHTIEELDISYNNLEGPPYWIWVESPQKLTQLNLSNNTCITNSFVDGYFEELLQYNILLTDIDLHNCKLKHFYKIVTTFPKAKSISLGSLNNTWNANSLIELPDQGLDRCSDLKRLTVCNTKIYTINPSIEKYKNLVELNLALNVLYGLPDEFCNLERLETCVLSGNQIMYLPEGFHKLKNLIRLYLDGNKLCVLPEMFCELTNLKTLDLYDNHLNEVISIFGIVEELDLAHNYCEEPEDCKYLEMKENLRLKCKNRHDGRKDHTSDESEDDEESRETFYDEEEIEVRLLSSYSTYLQRPAKEALMDERVNEGRGEAEAHVDLPVNPVNFDPPSSPEDWDSDDYWIPFYDRSVRATPRAQWLHFVRQKMKEGNFCPMDAHPVSVVDTVRYQRLCNPQINYESDGQFDDYSSDDS